MTPSDEAIEERMAEIATTRAGMCRYAKRNLEAFAELELRIAAHCEKPRPNMRLDEHAAELLRLAMRAEAGCVDMADVLMCCHDRIAPLWAPRQHHARLLRDTCARQARGAERAAAHGDAEPYHGEVVRIVRGIVILVPVLRGTVARLATLLDEISHCIGMSEGFCKRLSDKDLGSHCARLVWLHNAAKEELERGLPPPS